MAPLSLALALSLALSAPAMAGDGEYKIKSASPGKLSSDGKASSDEKYDKYMDQYHALMKKYKAAKTPEEREKISGQIAKVKAAIAELKEKPSKEDLVVNKPDPEKPRKPDPGKPPAGDTRSAVGGNPADHSAEEPLASVEGQAETMTAAPSQSSLQAQQEAGRAMSSSSARAMGSALRAAGGLRQALPQTGDLGAGGDAGSPGKDGPSSAGRVPDANRDLSLASAGAHGESFRAMGLSVRSGPDGRAHVVHKDGRPAQDSEVAELRRRISAEPAALTRYPSFFKAISRERYDSLKNSYGSPETKTAFRDVALSPAARDFLWSRSCSRVSGECNPHAVASSYKKGDYVPPSDLNNIWEDLEDDTLAAGAESDDFSSSEYTEEEEEAAKRALIAIAGMGGKTGEFGLGSLLDRVRAAAGGWLGDSSGRDGSSAAPVLASAVVVSGGRTTVAVFAPGAPRAGQAPPSSGKAESPPGESPAGSGSLLTKVAAGFGGLLLAIGFALRRRR